MNFIIITFFTLFTLLAWKRFFWACFFIILFLPTYLIRFSFLSIPTTFLEIMIGIIFIFWVLRLGNKDNRKLVQNRLNSLFRNYKSLLFAIGLFIIGAVIGVIISTNTRSALGEFKAFYIEPILFALILYTSLKNKKETNNLIFALILSGLATAILAIYQHFTGWMVPYAFWENRNTFRVTGWWGFPNGVGIYLAPIIPLAIYILCDFYQIPFLQKSSNFVCDFKKKYFRRLSLAKIFSFCLAQNFKISLAKTTVFTKNKFIRATSLLFVPLAMLAIFYAKSTGALIGVSAGLFFLLLFNKFTKIISIITALAIFLFVMFAPIASGIKQEVLLQDRSGQLRINMWGETVELLRHNPVFGIGLASYQKTIYPYRIDKWIEVFHHPHNQFLTMWVNVGIAGLFGFILILLWFFKTAFKNKNIFLFSAMIVFMVMGLVDSPYIKNDMAIIFWLLPTFLLFFNEKE